MTSNSQHDTAGKDVLMADQPLAIGILVWFVVASIVVSWDASFVLLRPHSMSGGDYFSFFQPYDLYITIDKMYADLSDGGTKFALLALSWMNLVEAFFQLLSIALWFVSWHRASKVVALGVSTATLSKTLFYALLEHASEGYYTKHNDFQTWLMLYIIPNYLWIAFPLIIIIHLGAQLVEQPKSKRL